MNTPPKVRGIGGVFTYSNNAEALAAWYEKFLGIQVVSSPQYGAYYCDYRYKDAADQPISLNWSIIQASKPMPKNELPFFCINYRVDNIDEFVAFLNANQIQTKAVEVYPEGKFTYLNDPDGNRIELWEPSADYFIK